MARLLKKPVGEMCTFDAPIDEVQPAVHRAATERLRIKEKLVYRSFYPFDTGDSAFYPVSTETNDPRMAWTQRRHFDQESDAGTLIGGYGSGNIYIAEFFAAGPRGCSSACLEQALANTHRISGPRTGLEPQMLNKSANVPLRLSGSR